MTKNNSYEIALRMLDRGFHVFPAADPRTANELKDYATNHLRVAEVMHAKDCNSPWFLRCRTRDELICFHAPQESEFRKLEKRWGVSFPNTWAVQSSSGRSYLLYGMDSDGPIFHTYQNLAGTGVELLLYCPLPTGAEFEWVAGFSPADLALASLPHEIVSKLPTKHATAKIGSITSRVVQRDEFNVGAHRNQYSKRTHQ